MDNKEYISSGILELYAAGALSQSESKDVETMASQYPEIQSEVDAINDAYNNYGSLFRKNPRPELRSKITYKIDEIEGSELIKGRKIINMPEMDYSKSYFSPKMRYLAAAVVVFLVLNIAGNFFLYYKWTGTEKQMTSFADENRKVKEQYEQIKNSMDKKTEDIKMVMNRSNKVFDLKGMEISPSSQATVYWDPNSKKVMLNVDNMPMPPSGKQYQLWALKNGKPMDAGIFDMDKDPMHMMPGTITDADAFAITLENKGGSPTPTLSQLYVMGKI